MITAQQISDKTLGVRLVTTSRLHGRTSPDRDRAEAFLAAVRHFATYTSGEMSHAEFEEIVASASGRDPFGQWAQTYAETMQGLIALAGETL